MKLPDIAQDLYEQSKLIVTNFGADILVQNLVYDLDGRSQGSDFARTLKLSSCSSR